MCKCEVSFAVGYYLICLKFAMFQTSLECFAQMSSVCLRKKVNSYPTVLCVSIRVVPFGPGTGMEL